MTGQVGGIIDRFGGYKVISLQFGNGHMTEDLLRYGEVLSLEMPRAKVRVERQEVSGILGEILARHTIDDGAWKIRRWKRSLPSCSR